MLCLLTLGVLLLVVPSPLAHYLAVCRTQVLHIPARCGHETSVTRTCMPVCDLNECNALGSEL